MNYILLVNISLVLFYLLYRYGLKRLTFLKWNRFYILLGLISSMLMPIGLYISYEVPQAMVIQIPELIIQAGIENVETAASPLQEKKQEWSISQIAMIIYGLGIVLGIGRLVYQFFLVNRRIANPAENESFSFFGTISMGEKVKDNSLMNKHEEIHVKQGHSYDLMLMDIICILNWFNPVVYLFRKEMKLLHEYLVDSNFGDSKVKYAELLLAYALNTNQYALSYEFSNKSLLKERITMLFKEKTKKNRIMIYFSVLPILALLMGLTQGFKTLDQEEVIQPLLEKAVMESSQVGNNEVEANEVGSTELVAKEQVLTEQESNKVSSTPIETGSINQAQEKAALDTIKLQNKKVVAFDQVDSPAEYPGGIMAFRKEVQEKIVYPASAIEAGIKGTCQYSFVIDVNGNITDIKVDKSLSPDLDQAVIKALANTQTWIPAKEKNENVPVKFSLPIRMDLSIQ